MENLSEKIIVDCTSDQNFNVISHLEGINNQNLHYIEDNSHCKISIIGSTNSGFAYEEDGPVQILIMGNAQEDIEKARDLCENLISTIKLQKQKALQAKAQKRAKKKKNGSSNVVLPEQFLLAMRHYFPGEPAEPPPPGSTQDIKQHRRNFKRVGKQNGWFTS